MTFTDPTHLFQAALVSLEAEDWLDLAGLCDEVSLRACKRQLVEQFAAGAQHMQFTAEMLMQQRPDMPGAAAEYEAAQYRKQTDPVLRLQHALPGVSSVAVLQSLEPVQVFAAWLDGRSPRRQVARLVELGHMTSAGAASAGASGSVLYDYVILGTVADGPDLAHVIFRQNTAAGAAWLSDAVTHMEQLPPDEQQLARENWVRQAPHFARCRRQADSTWRLHADHDFLRLGSMQIVGLAPNSEAT